MNRQLPVVTIGGHEFLVDVALSELRLKTDQLKTISFFEMKDKGDKYELKFDARAIAISRPYSYRENAIKVDLPQMVALDPEGMAIKYGIPVEQLTHRDKLLTSNEELVQKRLSGVLPELKIGPDNYIVDVRLMELRQKEDASKIIYLGHLPFSNDGEKYLALYDLQAKQALSVHMDINRLPDSTRVLVIPTEASMDPIGTAMKFGKHERLLLDRYPVQPKQEARLFRLEETSLKKDITAQQRAHPQQKQQSVRKKRGKRL